MGKGGKRVCFRSATPHLRRKPQKSNKNLGFVDNPRAERTKLRLKTEQQMEWPHVAGIRVHRYLQKRKKGKAGSAVFWFDEALERLHEALTAHRDVAVLPGSFGIHGVAPGTQAVIWISTVVVLQIFVPIP